MNSLTRFTVLFKLHQLRLKFSYQTSLTKFPSLFSPSRINKTMVTEDNKKPPAAVIDTTNVPTIKITSPKDVEKQTKVIEDVEKPQKSRLCQLLPVLLFLVTFATVLSVLITYMDPTSK
jgi:hypothetical protein